jgi:hypothetical protein
LLNPTYKRCDRTNLPYIPSTTIGGKLRSFAKDETEKFKLFGTEMMIYKSGKIGKILFLTIQKLA